MTDFASIPRPLWIILPRWGKYGNAAVIHDYCYLEQSRSRLESDRIFRQAMGVVNVAKCTICVMYCAVRLWGWLAWAGSKGKKKKGIDRIAATMPVKSVEVPDELRAKR